MNKLLLVLLFFVLAPLVFAGSFLLPNGTNPTIDIVGEIGLDTTDNQFLIGTSTDAAVIRTKVRIGGFYISSTTPPFFNGFVSGTNIPFVIETDGYIVREIHCDVDGGTSIVINFSKDGTNDTETLTCDADGASDISIDTNNHVTAGSVATEIQVGTVTGTVDYLRVSVFGTWIRE